MISIKRRPKPIIFGLAFATLILDSKTAIAGAKSGLEICLQTIIPSLFPFLFLSSLLSETLVPPCRVRRSIISRIYQIPNGSEGLLLTGLLGGYPVGAKCIGEAVSQNRLPTTVAERMLIFCNATGPAFLFGITANIFTQPWVPWVLWGIHLLSGLCIARFSSGNINNVSPNTSVSKRSIPQLLRRAIQSISEICGWIIIMRTISALLQKWCPWHLPESALVFISGILEISNGCISLSAIQNPGLRFVLCSLFLCFGGLCVALQTHSVSASVSQRKYIPGKCIQALIGFLLAYIVQHFAFQPQEQINQPLIFHLVLLLLCIILAYRQLHSKKVVEFC